MIVHPSKYPKYLRRFDIKGISVHCCINPDDVLSRKDMAHAHCLNGDPFQGWICLRLKHGLRQKKTLLHEVAHLLANQNESVKTHGKEWKKAVRSIGGTFKSYVYVIGNLSYSFKDYTRIFS